MAVLFLDIRNFTGLSEQISPDELVAFLAEFRERMARVIFAIRLSKKRVRTWAGGCIVIAGV